MSNTDHTIPPHTHRYSYFPSKNGLREKNHRKKKMWSLWVFSVGGERSANRNAAMRTWHGGGGTEREEDGHRGGSTLSLFFEVCCLSLMHGYTISWKNLLAQYQTPFWCVIFSEVWLEIICSQEHKEAGHTLLSWKKGSIWKARSVWIKWWPNWDNNVKCSRS